jgi:hypothetical protein
MRRAVPLVFILLVACKEPLPPYNPDGGQAACFQPRDGGVFLTGLVSPVPGCALTGQATGVIDLDTAGWAPAGGLMVVPPGAASAPLPLVFVFHGAFSSGETVRQQFQLEAAADGGAIFLYPNASAGTWDLGPLSRDGRLVDQLLRNVSDNYCIDPQRLYVAGFSAGAVFTLFMGCNEAPTFAAMGTVAGSDTRFDLRCCSGSISGLFIHGTADTTISFDEGQSAMSDLLVRDGCPSTGTSDGPNCSGYRGCSSGESVDWCPWDGAHAIPDWGGLAVWNFFARRP